MDEISQPKIFIIILNFNGQDVLAQCLSSVYQSNSLNFEVVVVDNNSKDDSVKKIEKFITKIIQTRRVKKELDLNADILADRYIDYFSIITHLCCITPFFIKNMFLLLVIVLFISLILFFALPYVIVLFDKIVQYTDSVIEKGNN